MSQPVRHSPPRTPPRSVLEDLVARLIDHREAFHTFLSRRVGDPTLAEDLLQHGFLKAVEHAHALRNDGSVVPWFYRILRHTLIDYYRARAAEDRRQDAALQERLSSGDESVPPPDEIKGAVCACLEPLLRTLRPGYAELLRRIDLAGEPIPTVAQDLKITANNATVRLHRARKALRKSLEDACGVCSRHGCLNCTCASPSSSLTR